MLYNKTNLSYEVKMNAADHGVQYSNGWTNAKEMLDDGITSTEIQNLYPSNSSFDIGARDCVTQWEKTGQAEMIKIASCVVVVDPDTGFVLSATRRGTTDDWGIIGGKTDGEAPLFAACREFVEETGINLISAPDYMGCFIDDQEWFIHVFIVTDRVEAKMICDDFRSGHREIEPGILVGLVPYSELMVKTFARFNIDLITWILKALS